MSLLCLVLFWSCRDMEALLDTPRSPPLPRATSSVLVIIVSLNKSSQLGQEGPLSYSDRMNISQDKRSLKLFWYSGSFMFLLSLSKVNLFSRERVQQRHFTEKKIKHELVIVSCWWCAVYRDGRGWRSFPTSPAKCRLRSVIWIFPDWSLRGKIFFHSLKQ